jgi:hypothetical protein
VRTGTYTNEWLLGSELVVALECRHRGGEEKIKAIEYGFQYNIGIGYN